MAFLELSLHHGAGLSRIGSWIEYGRGEQTWVSMLMQWLWDCFCVFIRNELVARNLRFILCAPKRYDELYPVLLEVVVIGRSSVTYSLTSREDDSTTVQNSIK
jgi:hypothetical protein